ncbi:MAG: hypothetical protein M4579_000395 [Chaenotheca gracillima]|nr:MAG: hypothetical protein M4579_000395 [Chaenotheca gracillima]
MLSRFLPNRLIRIIRHIRGVPDIDQAPKDAAWYREGPNINTDALWGGSSMPSPEPPSLALLKLKQLSERVKAAGGACHGEGLPYPNLSEGVSSTSMDCVLGTETDQVSPRVNEDARCQSRNINLSFNEIELFANVLTSRRRRRLLKRDLRQCEQTVAEQKNALLEGARELELLLKREGRLPHAERLERLKTRKRAEIVEGQNEEKLRSYEIQEQRRQTLLVMLQNESGEYHTEKKLFFNTYEDAFFRAGVLTEMNDESIIDWNESPILAENRSREGTLECESLEVGGSEQNSADWTSVEHEAHAPTKEDLKQLRAEIEYRRHQLDNRHDIYDEGDEARRDEISKGRSLSFTTTLYGLEMFKEGAITTRALIDAENNYHAAQLRRLELGYSNETDLESDFADDPNDGYRESFEAEIAAEVDRERILRWLANQSCPSIYTPAEKYDPEKVLPSLGKVRFGESLSVIEASQKNKDKLVWWGGETTACRAEARKEKLRRETKMSRRSWR